MDETDPLNPCNSIGGTPPPGSGCFIEIQNELITPDGDGINDAFIINYLKTQKIDDADPLTEEDLTQIVVPARIGLNKKFLHMSLKRVLCDLFSTENCGYESSTQLLALMVNGVDMWEFIKEQSPAIVVE